MARTRWEVVGLPPRDRQEDEDQSGLDEWWAKQLGRKPRRSSGIRTDAELSDALSEADEAAAEEERERADAAERARANRKSNAGNAPSAVAGSDVEQKLRIVEDRIREATTRLAEATTRLERAEDQLAGIEEQRHTLAGEAAISRRAIADFQELLENSQRELAALHTQEAHHKLDRAVEARQLAVREAASALEWIKTALEQLDARRTAVAQAREELRAIDPEARLAIPPEPELLNAAWDALIPLLRTRIDERLEIDLVEAAVASQRANAIEELPQHLRELARQRRNQRMREALQRQHGKQ
jgi:hypothetical protein